MLREKIRQSGFAKEKGFRWRGDGDISRIEGFSDNVFGFALTLLVVSLEVPRTFSDLQNTMSGFIGFAFAFALFFVFWFEHYKYFRRFGLEGNVILWLNAALLFMILFFVYPLKFLVTLLVKQFSGVSTKVLLEDGTLVPAIQNEQWITMMLAYGLGFIIIYGILTVMYVYAYMKRKELDLNEIEITITKGSIKGHTANCIIGIISISFVLFGGSTYAAFSGFTYCIIVPVQGLLGYLNGRKISKLA